MKQIQTIVNTVLACALIFLLIVTACRICRHAPRRLPRRQPPGWPTTATPSTWTRPHGAGQRDGSRQRQTGSGADQTRCAVQRQVREGCAGKELGCDQSK